MYIEKKPGIYCITCVDTGKRYIGQSVNIYNRWQQHKYELNSNKHYNDYLQNAWNKYGADQFNISVLEYCSIEDLNENERYYINLYDTINRSKGYNLKSGGQDTFQYSNDTKQKLSDAIKKSYLDPDRRKIQQINALKQWANPEIKKKISGANNGMFGKHHSEEAKQKISEARKGASSSRRNTTPVFCVELGRTFKDATIAHQELSLDSGGILKVCRGERKTCGGYHWKFTTLENNIS